MTETTFSCHGNPQRETDYSETSIQVEGQVEVVWEK